MRSLGIDPSTKTGLVLIDTEKNETIHHLVHFPKLSGVKRLLVIQDQIGSLLDAWRPDMVMLENYAISRFGGSVIITVEVGTILRMLLHFWAVDWYVVPPSTVKQFATGKGNAPKQHVMDAVRVRWGFETGRDDVADAYVLAQMGLALSRDGAKFHQTWKGIQQWT